MSWCKIGLSTRKLNGTKSTCCILIASGHSVCHTWCNPSHKHAIKTSMYIQMAPLLGLEVCPALLYACRETAWRAPWQQIPLQRHTVSVWCRRSGSMCAKANLGGAFQNCSNGAAARPVTYLELLSIGCWQRPWRG
jgi:hypothetical protein